MGLQPFSHLRSLFSLNMKKSIFSTISLSVLMILMIYQSMTKQHLLKTTIAENVQTFSLMDSNVLSNTDNQLNVDIPSYITDYSSRGSTVSYQNDVTDEPVIDKNSKEMENVFHIQRMSQVKHSTTVATKLIKTDFKTTASPDHSLDDLIQDTKSDVTTYKEFKGGTANIATDSFRNKTSKVKFSPHHSSIKNRCKKLLLKNLNATLDESVLQTLLKQCFGKKAKQAELILDKRFLRNKVGSVSCPKIKPRYLKTSEPLVALASFPGSGNTWTRILLERATGIYTGSLYKDQMANFEGSWRCPTKAGVLVAKTHRPFDLVQRHGCPTNTKFARAIFLLRNPFDAILAEFNRVKGGKVGFANKKAYSSNEWRQFVKHFSKRWMKMVFFWMAKYKKPVHVLVYEDLQYNTILETYRLMNFLHVKVTLRTLYCLVNKPQEEYYRAVKPEWMIKSKLFDKKMIANINAYIKFVRQKVDITLKNRFKKYSLAMKS